MVAETTELNKIQLLLDHWIPLPKSSWEVNRIACWIYNSPFGSEYAAAFHENGVNYKKFINLKLSNLNQLGVKSQLHKNMFLSIIEKARKTPPTELRLGRSNSAPMWTSENVLAWLDTLPFGWKFIKIFEHLKIDGKRLVRFTDRSLEILIGIKKKILRKRYLLAINNLSKRSCWSHLPPIEYENDLEGPLSTLGFFSPSFVITTNLGDIAKNRGFSTAELSEAFFPFNAKQINFSLYTYKDEYSRKRKRNLMEVKDVEIWLKKLGYSEKIKNIFKTNNIDGNNLFDLDKNDLKDKLKIQSNFDRISLWCDICFLKKRMKSIFGINGLITLYKKRYFQNIKQQNKEFELMKSLRFQYMKHGYFGAIQRTVLPLINKFLNLKFPVKFTPEKSLNIKNNVKLSEKIIKTIQNGNKIDKKDKNDKNGEKEEKDEKMIENSKILAKMPSKEEFERILGQFADIFGNINGGEALFLITRHYLSFYGISDGEIDELFKFASEQIFEEKEISKREINFDEKNENSTKNFENSTKNFENNENNENKKEKNKNFEKSNFFKNQKKSNEKGGKNGFAENFKKTQKEIAKSASRAELEEKLTEMVTKAKILDKKAKNDQFSLNNLSFFEKSTKNSNFASNFAKNNSKNINFGKNNALNGNSISKLSNSHSFPNLNNIAFKRKNKKMKYQEGTVNPPPPPTQPRPPFDVGNWTQIEVMSYLKTIPNLKPILDKFITINGRKLMDLDNDKLNSLGISNSDCIESINKIINRLKYRDLKKYSVENWTKEQVQSWLEIGTEVPKLGYLFNVKNINGKILVHLDHDILQKDLNLNFKERQSVLIHIQKLISKAKPLKNEITTMNKNVHNTLPISVWTSVEVISWLMSFPFGSLYKSQFEEENMNGNDLIKLTEDDFVVKLGIPIAYHREEMMLSLNSYKLTIKETEQEQKQSKEIYSDILAINNEPGIIIECSFCKKRYSNANKLIVHLSIHEKNCSFCSDSFSSDYLLSEHIGKVHKKAMFKRKINNIDNFADLVNANSEIDLEEKLVEMLTKEDSQDTAIFVKDNKNFNK